MSKLWLLLLALTPLFKGDVKQQIILPNDYETIEENTFIANSPIIPQTQTFGMIVDNVIPQTDIVYDVYEVKETSFSDGIKHKEALECLVFCESGGNENLEGDHDLVKSGKLKDLSRGILQFQKQTFIDNCVNKYNIASINDYLNAEKQILCADKMLSEENGWRHWFNCSTIKENCLQYLK